MSPRISYAVARPFVKRIAGYAYSFMFFALVESSNGKKTEGEKGGKNATLNRTSGSDSHIRVRST